MDTHVAGTPPTDLCRVIARDGILVQLADGELNGPLADQYLRHVRVCGHCLALASNLLYLDALVKEQVIKDLEAGLPFGMAATGRGLIVNHLTPGQRLSADVYDGQGHLILMGGTLLSPNIIAALQARGISELHFTPPTAPAETASAPGVQAAPATAEPLIETDEHPRLYLQEEQVPGPSARILAATADISFQLDSASTADPLTAEIPVEVPEGFFFSERGTPRKFHPNDYRDLLFVAQAEASISQATKLRAYSQLEKSLTNLKEAGVADLAPVQQVSRQVVDELLADDRVTCSLADMFLVSSQLFSHCFNTLVTFVSLGRSLQFTPGLLQQGGTAALLHDIGRILPLRPGEDPTIAYRQHTERGYRHLQQQGGFEPVLLEMVRNHHERADGRGFTRGLTLAELTLAEQVLILANVYDSLITDPVHGVKRSFQRAAQAIVQSGGRLVSREVTHAFVQVFGMYPPGTLVQLRSREVGVVREANYGRPFQPQIALLRDAQGEELSEPVLLDLAVEAVPIERALDAEAVLSY